VGWERNKKALIFLLMVNPGQHCFQQRDAHGWSTFCFSSSLVESLGKQSVLDGYMVGLVRLPGKFAFLVFQW